MKLPTLSTIRGALGHTTTRRRWAIVAVLVTAVAGTGIGIGVASSGSDGAPEAVRATTTTTSTTTSTTVAATTTVAPPGLREGSAGPEVEALQRRLTELRYDPGPVDGKFGLATTYAVQAFQKLNGMAPDGQVTDAVQAALAAPAPISPLAADGGANRVEVDLTRQVLYVYLDNSLRLVTHVSTGNNQRYCVEGDCQVAETPIGAFRFSWRATGWWEARLGSLYNPVYFTSDGVAVHGSLSVPTHPASHGCVRIPMHIAEYFPGLVRRGDPIFVTDGRPVGPPPPVPSSPPTTTRPIEPPPTSSTTTTTTTTTAPPTPSTTPGTTSTVVETTTP
jgi:lipoprotein-anchoring transpeptidase ErfK/SrfK